MVIHALATLMLMVGLMDGPPDLLPGPLTVAHSGLCLGIEDSSLADGAAARQQLCDDSPDQTWRGSARGELIADHSGKCLQPESTADGAAVRQFTCDAQDDGQVWQLNLVNGTNYLYNIVSSGTGMCLTVENGSVEAGAPVHMRPCDPATDGQIWVNTKPPPPEF